MDLREKLRRLGVQKGTHHLKPARPRRHPAIDEVIDGELVETEHGCFFLVRESYPLEYRHGNWPLAAILEQPAINIGPLARDISLEGFDFRKALFIDTETTGLAGGTGTYAFLVGVGYLGEEAFHLAQFFMRDYDDEPALLSELARFMQQFSGLVSFNGRAFDWPLLETRFIMSRQLAPLRNVPHLDLLQLARRLWRARLSSCALSSLEEHILGVKRTSEDVPGWLVPQIYFRYLQEGDASLLRQVFYHNAQDILSLVTLSAYLGRIGSDPFNGCLIHGDDFYSLGRLFEKLGDFEAAAHAYKRALTCPISTEIRQVAISQLSFLYKRLGRYEEAVELWRSALGGGQLYPYIELAKYYEHKCKEYAQAEALVCEALSLARAGKGQGSQQLVEELEHRLRRLRSKMAKASPC